MKQADIDITYQKVIRDLGFVDPRWVQGGSDAGEKFEALKAKNRMVEILDLIADIMLWGSFFLFLKNGNIKALFPITVASFFKYFRLYFKMGTLVFCIFKDIVDIYKGAYIVGESCLAGQVALLKNARK